MTGHPGGHDRVVIAHGGGGELTSELIRDRFLPPLRNNLLATLADGAILPTVGGELVFTTDSYVVTPIEFPGGDIGRLSVAGTVNDLAVMGAEPVALSLALILEEGLRLATLDRIVASIAATAREANVQIVTGDTKVVEWRAASEADDAGLFITTAGVGRRPRGVTLGMERVEAGDAVLVSGTLADHGLAIMSLRHGIEFESILRSDAAPLYGLVRTLFRERVDVRFLRDATRGGVAGVLADIAEARGLSIEIDEECLPILPAARHAAELLGLDPLTVANEGKLVAVVAARDAERALEAWRADPLGADAAIVGRVVGTVPPLVELITRVGGRRIVQRPYGEDLPRIC